MVRQSLKIEKMYLDFYVYKFEIQIQFSVAVLKSFVQINIR